MIFVRHGESAWNEIFNKVNHGGIRIQINSSAVTLCFNLCRDNWQSACCSCCPGLSAPPFKRFRNYIGDPLHAIYFAACDVSQLFFGTQKPLTKIYGQVLLFVSPRSVFLDSPLSREGIAQVHHLILEATPAYLRVALCSISWQRAPYV